jgi:uncharacterized membrane protein
LFLTQSEADAIDARVREVESRTGVQVITAVVRRCDSYPESVWKAFALGVAVAALLVFAADLLRPDWMGAHAVLTNVLPVIGAGAGSAAAALAFPAYARLFLDRFRTAGEVRQHAQAMFLARGLSRTPARNGVLILASLFERRVEVLADIGFAGRVGESDWQSVVDATTPLLAQRRPAPALMRGLDALERMLVAKGFRADGRADGALPDRPIEEEGA